MSNSNEHTPFFARYLEGQIQDLSEEEMEAVAGGAMDVVTMRYPSDNEDAGDGEVTTKKYPSDQEDSGMGSTSKTVDCDFQPHSGYPSFPNFPSF
jgi:Serine endopeptidase inhibitors